MNTRSNSQSNAPIPQEREWDEEINTTIFSQFENFLSKNSQAYKQAFKAVSTKEYRITKLESHISQVEIDPFKARLPKPPGIQWPSSIAKEDRAQAEIAIQDQFKQFALARLNIELELLQSDLSKHQEGLNQLQDCDYTISQFVTVIKPLLLSLELPLTLPASSKARMRTSFVISMNNAVNAVKTRPTTPQRAPTIAPALDTVNKDSNHSELLIATIKELSDQVKALKLRPNGSARGREPTPHRRRDHDRGRSSSAHSKRSSPSITSSPPRHHRKSSFHQPYRVDRGEGSQERDKDLRSNWQSRNHLRSAPKKQPSPRRHSRGYKN